MPQYRTERVRIHTDRLELTGNLTLPSEGYRSRLTDFLNAVDQEFLALTEVETRAWDGGQSSRHAFVAVARRQIVFCAPVDETAGDQTS
jgi:hypothetical protein